MMSPLGAPSQVPRRSVRHPRNRCAAAQSFMKALFRRFGRRSISAIVLSMRSSRWSGCLGQNGLRCRRQGGRSRHLILTANASAASRTGLKILNCSPSCRPENKLRTWKAHWNGCDLCVHVTRGWRCSLHGGLSAWRVDGRFTDYAFHVNGHCLRFGKRSMRASGRSRPISRFLVCRSGNKLLVLDKFSL